MLGVIGAETTVRNILGSASDFGLTQDDANMLLQEVQGKVSAHWRECLLARGVPPSSLALLEPCFKPLT